MNSTKTRSTGFLAIDALAGIFLLAAMAITLAVSANLRLRNAAALADQRRALSAAQEALANLRLSGQASTNDPEAHISITPTGKTLAGLEWVEVVVVRNSRRATLVGLAKAGASPIVPSTQPGGAR